MNRRPKLQDDQMSGCRSFSSNYQPCSQSRKMSIGITIDSFAKSKPENRHQNKEAVVVLENVKPSQGNSLVNGDNRKLNTDITTNLEERIESLEKENTPWVSPKSVGLKLPPDGNLYPKQTMDLPVLSELHPVCIEEEETSATCPVQSFANQIFGSNCNEQKEKMSGMVISEGKRKKDGSVIEQVSNKVAADMNHENSKGCEFLKLKLWEILGPVSSPNKHIIDSQQSQDLNVTSKPMHPEQKGNTHGNPGGNDKQNSDTIESETQKPTDTLRRPVTRSLAQKKVCRRQKTIKRRNSPTTCYKDRLDKDIFSFKDGWPGGLSGASNDGLPASKRKKVSRQSFGAEKRECSVLKENNAQSSKQSQDRGKVLLSSEKSSSRGNAMPFVPQNLDKVFCQTKPRWMKEVTKDIDSLKLQQIAGQPECFSHSSLNNRQSPDRGKILSSTEKSSSRGNIMPFGPQILDTDFCQTEPRRMEEVTKDIDCPNLQRSAGQPEGFVHSYLNNKVLTDASSRSPSIEMNSPVPRSTSASPTIREVQDLHECRTTEIITNTKRTQSLKETDISTRSPSTEMNTPVRRSSLASPTIHKVQDVDEHSSGQRISNTKGMQSLKESLGNLKYSHSDSGAEVDEDSEYCPNGSSSEEVSERSEDSLHRRGYQPNEVVSPDIATGSKPNSVSTLHKMFSGQKGIKTDKRTATVSSKGGKARRKLMRHLEKNQDDGLTSAIALFALALERLRGKVKSITQKKSAEILKSVADEIYLQLQNAETQIQANMDKVAEHGRSKRKRLQTQFQDLQGKLIVIHERFKEEVNQQVQDYRDTLEGSEALKVELSGSMEKQRALHRKLLSQAEEAIGNKLSDAQTRIDAVHNLGRGKMVQFKNIVAEVLRDGVVKEMVFSVDR